MKDPWIMGVVCGVALVLIVFAKPIKVWPPVPKKALGPFDVYVINLDKAERRLDHFKKQFAQSDLASNGESFIRFSAVEGRSLDLQATVSHRALREITEAERTGFRMRHYQLSRGAVGCFLSHVRLWQSILGTDKHAALIFEDDAQIHPRLRRYLQSTLVPADYDILLLGYVCFKCSRDEAAGWHRVKRFFGLHGYVISRRGIQKILGKYAGRISPVRKQIDTVLSDMAEAGEITVYAARRKWVEQANETFRTQIQIPIKKGENGFALPPPIVD